MNQKENSTNYIVLILLMVVCLFGNENISIYALCFITGTIIFVIVVANIREMFFEYLAYKKFLTEKDINFNKMLISMKREKYSDKKDVQQSSSQKTLQ